MFAEVNDHGFIESTYRKIRKLLGESVVTNSIEYLSADDEDRVLVAQASTKRNDKGNLIEAVKTNCKKNT